MSQEEKRVIGYDRGLVEDWRRWKNFEPGMWAWLLHGFTGGVILGYLGLQVIVYGVAYWLGEAAFVSIANALGGSTVVKLVNLGVFTAFVFHMFNGIRITLFDMALGVDRQKELFYASLILTGVLVIIAIPLLLPGVF